ncbi:hypothetical protein PG996_008742 [Apiospora saccharicola]|uniref:Uncharacterized protein n=1 Tax=Apiospora saccharicola TaxID=335842 RepID=A0ABR1UYW2_9PEZI
MSTDLRRYLVETFPAGATSPEAVVVQGDLSSGHHWARGVQNLARDLGLAARIVEVTPDPDEPFEVADRRWVVVGPKKPGVGTPAHPVMYTTENRHDLFYQQLAETRHEKFWQQSDAVRAREAAVADEEQRSQRAALDKCEDWDSNLMYGQDLTIAVYRKRTAKGTQMYATFDFIVTNGVFRFERHRKDTKLAASSRDDTKKGKKARHSDDGDDSEAEGENSDDGSNEEDYLNSHEPSRSPTPEAFYFGSIPQPSAECRTWNYRWRGNDSGTNEIQLYSDEGLFEIKWYGPRAEKLKGTFGGDFLDNCTFTGVQIGVGADLEDIDIAEEWDNRNEHAHTLASRCPAILSWARRSGISTLSRGRSRGDVRGSSQTPSRRLHDVKSQWYIHVKSDVHPNLDARRNHDLQLSSFNFETSTPESELTSHCPPKPPCTTNKMPGRTHQGRSFADHLADDDERHYRQMDYAEARRNTGLNIEGYMTNKQKAEQMNRLAEEEIRYKIAQREKNDPLYRAQRNGNKPSWGARIDAEILAEEQEMLRKKKT